jgi:hypothetical protein
MKTLRALAENVRAGQSLEIELGDFLDGFYRQRDAGRNRPRGLSRPEIINRNS